MKATLQKWGNSQALRLTKDILGAAGFSENEAVEIFADKTGIRIQKTQKIETLDDLFRNYNGDYKCAECDTGTPVGKEVW
jgi:antitoxin MazE